MTKKAGRPKRYSTEEMKKLLMNFVEENPNSKITYVDLEKATGIGRNTWARNMKVEIQKINEPFPVSNSLEQEEKLLPLPNILELVKYHYSNQNKLFEILGHVNKSMQNLYIQAKRVQEIEQENQQLKLRVQILREENQNYQETVNGLKEEVKHYSQAYRNIAATSTYGDKGLKNVFQFKKGDKENEKKISANLTEQFNMFSSE